MLSSRTWRPLLLAAALCALPAASPAAPAKPDDAAPGDAKPGATKLAPADAKAGDPKLAFERYTLPNGLEVILALDRRVPIVAVNIWYAAPAAARARKHVGGEHPAQQLGPTGPVSRLPP